VERLAPVARGRPAEAPAMPPVAPLPRPIDAIAFVTDPATAHVMAALFGAAGVGRVQFGGIAAALQVLAAAPCPQVLVIDISEEADPIGRLDNLADLCPPGTGVIIVGAAYDPGLAQELRAMGIAHFLPKPIAPDHMRAALIAESTSADAEPLTAPGAAPGPAGGPAMLAPAIVSDMPAEPIAPMPVAPRPAVSPMHGPMPEAFPSFAAPVAPAAYAPAAAEFAPAAPSLAANASFAPSSPFAPMPPAAPSAAAFQPAPRAPEPPAEPAFPSAPLPTPVDTVSRRVRPSQPGVSDPVSRAIRAQPQTPMAPVVTLPGVEPLGRPVDLLAFLTDAATANLVAAVLGAEGAGRAQPGGIAAAIAYLKESACPKVLVVDVSGLPDAMSQVDVLAEVCTPGTNVIVIGDTNDINLYRQLREAGVSDYLVKPLQANALKTAILTAVTGGASKALAHANKPMIVFIGARGGVGCSTVAINSAAILAQSFAKKTMLVDLDLQFGSTALALDIDPGTGLRDALEQPERVDSMFLNSLSAKISDNFYVLAAEESLTESASFKTEGLEKLIEELRRHFDAIVLDIPRHAASQVWRVLGYATSVVVVADQSLVGIRDTTRLIGAAKEAMDPAKVKVLVTESGTDRGSRIAMKEFEAALNRKVDFIVPEDAKSVSAAGRAGKPVIDVQKNARIVATLRQICTKLIGEAEAPLSAGERDKPKRRFSLFSRKKK
jgi:pilus assembly protein CpaE